jgi:hypothetical protein
MSDPRPTWTPAAPESLPALLADWLAAPDATTRMAIDGPPAAQPEALADALLAELRVRSCPAAHIRAAHFWRDASLRLEYGRQDVESYLSWLDAGALRREALDAVVAAPPRYLPSLRDPVTNRSTRAAPVRAAPGMVLIVSGALLLRHDLPFDRTVHLSLGAAALARRTPAEHKWTLPAYDDYATEVQPMNTADVVIRMDDPHHPAIRFR